MTWWYTPFLPTVYFTLIRGSISDFPGWRGTLQQVSLSMSDLACMYSLLINDGI